MFACSDTQKQYLLTVDSTKATFLFQWSSTSLSDVLLFSRQVYNMSLTLTISVLLILIIIVKFVLPILIRHSQLQKDYRNISPLPLSSIPFVGNLHQFDRRIDVVFQLILRLTKGCQDQDKGVFCLWTGPKPMVILCSSKGLEVREKSIIFSRKSQDFF